MGAKTKIQSFIINFIRKVWIILSISFVVLFPIKNAINPDHSFVRGDTFVLDQIIFAFVAGLICVLITGKILSITGKKIYALTKNLSEVRGSYLYLLILFFVTIAVAFIVLFITVIGGVAGLSLLALLIFGSIIWVPLLVVFYKKYIKSITN